MPVPADEGLYGATRSSGGTSPPSTRAAVAAGMPQHDLVSPRAEGRYEEEGWRVRKDGSLFWGNVVITAIRDKTARSRIREGHARSHAASLAKIVDERDFGRQSGDRSSGCWSRACATTRSSCSTLAGDPTWNAGAQHIKGYAAEEIDRPALPVFYPRRRARAAPGAELEVARARAASRRKAGACARTARCSGPTS